MAAPTPTAALERAVAENRAEMVHDVGKVRHPAEVAVESTGAVERGGDLGTFEAVEQDGQVGERDGRVTDVAGVLQRVDGRFEQDEGLTRVAVDGFDTGGFSGHDTRPTPRGGDRGDDQRFTHGVERTCRIGVGEGPAERIQRTGDPERVPWARAAVTASSASARASLDPPDDGQHQDPPYQTGDVCQSR